MGETDSHDWSKNIVFGEDCLPERRRILTLVLNDMARQPAGQKILEGLGDKKFYLLSTDAGRSSFSVQESVRAQIAYIRDKPMAPPPSIDYANALENTLNCGADGVININFAELLRTFKINSKTGELAPWTVNSVVAHELAHAANFCQRKSNGAIMSKAASSPSDTYAEEKSADSAADKYTEKEPSRSVYMFFYMHPWPVLKVPIYYENGEYDADRISHQVREALGERYISNIQLQLLELKVPFIKGKLGEELKTACGALYGTLQCADIENLSNLSPVERAMLLNAAALKRER